MEKELQAKVEQLRSDDADIRYQAFLALLQAAKAPVDWAYEVWDELLDHTRSKNNHLRTIAVQLLCQLAKSDPKQRILKDFPKLMAVTHDEKFVTARHSLQALWKIGLAGKKQQKFLLAGLVARYDECVTEKNGTLIRYDIVESMRKLYDVNQDEAIRTQALAMIEQEADLKYRKKYAGVWKK